MDASALLSKQGWRGSGYSLDKSNHGLAKPLLVSRKVDALGLGTKKDDFSNQWWLRAWDTPKTTDASTASPTTAPTYLPHTLNSRITGSRGLYSHFVKAGTLWGTIDETPQLPPSTDRKEKMAVKSESGPVKETTKDGKKRKRGEDKSDVLTTKTKKSKKDKKEKRHKIDRHARDLTPSAEDVEDVFFVDTTGSTTKPAAETSKSSAVSKRDKKNETAEKRSRKLAEKQERKQTAKTGGKKSKKSRQPERDNTDFSAIEDSPDGTSDLTDTDADYVAIGDTSHDSDRLRSDSKDRSARQSNLNPSLPRSSNKFHEHKAKREGRLDDDTTDDGSDLKSIRGKTKKKKAFLRTPEEKAAAEAGRPKVKRGETYAREKKLREQKRASKAQHMTPEQLAAEKAEKKEKKKLRREREAQKAADEEQKKLSRNQRKAVERAAKSQWLQDQSAAGLASVA